MQLCKGIEHQPHRFGFAGANADNARNAELPIRQLQLGLLHQQDNLLGALAQAHAIAREHARSIGALEQFHAQLALKISYLARERGLRHM